MASICNPSALHVQATYVAETLGSGNCSANLIPSNLSFDPEEEVPSQGCSFLDQGREFASNGAGNPDCDGAKVFKGHVRSRSKYWTGLKWVRVKDDLELCHFAGYSAPNPFLCILSLSNPFPILNQSIHWSSHFSRWFPTARRWARSAQRLPRLRRLRRGVCGVWRWISSRPWNASSCAAMSSWLGIDESMAMMAMMGKKDGKGGKHGKTHL